MAVKPGDGSEHQPTVAEARAEAQARQRVEREARRARWAEVDEIPGRPILIVSWVGTASFALSAVAAATWRYDIDIEPPGDPLGAVVALVLFGLGCLAFLVALWLGIQRSRESLLGIAGWFFLMGSAPRRVQVHLLGSLGIEVAVALVTAAARPFSTLAFGILVPTYGLALCGIWSALHGRFPPR